jgi:hypothetical protein
MNKLPKLPKLLYFNKKRLSRLPILHNLQIFHYYNIFIKIFEKLKVIPLQIIDINSNYLASAIYKYIYENSIKFPFTSRIYESEIRFVRPEQKRMLVGERKFDPELNNIMLFIDPNKKSKIPIPFFIGKAITKSSDGELIYRSSTISISVFRGSLDVDKFITDVITSYNITNEEKFNYNLIQNRFKIVKISGSANNQEINFSSVERIKRKKEYEKELDVDSINFYSGYFLKWKESELGEKININPLDNLYFPKETLKLIQEAKFWFNSKKWYESKPLPWKRGWMLYGKPGTGKTALVRAIAQELQIPIYFFDIGSLTNSELIDEWRNMIDMDTPCIALIEDFDGIYNKRERVGENKNYASFDTILNCLDGIEEISGVFVVITTNCIEKIDPAIGIPIQKGSTQSTRPGRIDTCIELKELNKDGRIAMAKRILSEWPQFQDELVKNGEGLTGAQFQDLCSQYALKLFWNDKKN